MDAVNPPAPPVVGRLKSTFGRIRCNLFTTRSVFPHNTSTRRNAHFSFNKSSF
jgi:hypothetical protein